MFVERDGVSEGFDGCVGFGEGEGLGDEPDGGDGVEDADEFDVDVDAVPLILNE